jgi:hypothetical protein
VFGVYANEVAEFVENFDKVGGGLYFV